MGVLVGVVVVGLRNLDLLPTTFIPASDRSLSTLNFELPPGTRRFARAVMVSRHRWSKWSCDTVTTSTWPITSRR